MPVADAEIIFGPLTEYTGLRFALFLLAEYAGIVVLCLLTSVLFLGGWQGPVFDSWVWTLVKAGALAFCGDLAAGELSATSCRPAATVGVAGVDSGGVITTRSHWGGEGRVVDETRSIGTWRWPS